MESGIVLLLSNQMHILAILVGAVFVVKAYLDFNAATGRIDRIRSESNSLYAEYRYRLSLGEEVTCYNCGADKYENCLCDYCGTKGAETWDVY